MISLLVDHLSIWKRDQEPCPESHQRPPAETPRAETATTATTTSLHGSFCATLGRPQLLRSHKNQKHLHDCPERLLAIQWLSIHGLGHFSGDS